MRQRLKSFIAVLYSIFCVGTAFSYTDGTVLVLDAGATTLTINNSGPLGGSKVLTFPNTGTQKIKVWMSPARYANRGSETPCANPCSQSLPTEYGKGLYMYEITDNMGTSYSPPKLSSQLDIPFTPQPCTAPLFSVPAAVHGFKDYYTCFSFNVAGGTTGPFRIWLNTFNLRQNIGSVWVNNQPEKILATIPVLGFTSNGSVCTYTTEIPHGFLTNDVIDSNGFTNFAGGLVGVGVMNTHFTVVNSPTTTTFTVACSLASGDWYTGFLPGTPGYNQGAQVSKIMFYGDNKRHHGGMYIPHESFQALVPLGPSEITVGATNTISLRFKDVADVNLHVLQHGWYTDWSIVQPDVEISQIVVSGGSLNAVASATAHGFVDGDTVIIRDAPGPKWRFNGKCVVLSHTTNTFTFAWGCGIPVGAGTPGVAPYLTPNNTYTINPSRVPSIILPDKMYAARSLIPASSFSAYNPTVGTFGGNATNGLTLASTAALGDPNNYLPNNNSLAKCSDCHSEDLRDLTYFGFNEYVTIVAAMRRRLTEQQGKDIAAAVTANTVGRRINGRPWNPAYQPCPGLDSQTITNWAAGCGEHWTLTRDEDIYEYACPAGDCVTQWLPTAKMNVHELPLYVPAPTWFDFLPILHPLDQWHVLFGTDFTTSPQWAHAQTLLTDYPICTLGSTITSGSTTLSLTGCTNIGKYLNNDYIQIEDEYIQCSAGAGTTTLTGCTRGACPVGTGCPSATAHTAGVAIPDFTAYVNGTSPYADQTPDLFNTCPSCPASARAWYQWPGTFGKYVNGIFGYIMSKGWEVRNRFSLENFNDRSDINRFGMPSARCTAAYKRGWNPSYMMFRWGLHVAVGGDGEPFFYNDNTNIAPTNWNRFTERAYNLQAILNAGNCHAEGNAPIDVPYQFAFYGSTSITYPASWTNATAGAFLSQAWFGWPNVTADGSSYPALQNMRLGIVLPSLGNSTFGDLLMTDARESDVMNGLAQNYKGAIDPSVYSVVNWQALFDGATFADVCPRSQVAVPGAAGPPSFSSNCYQDNVAYGLQMFHFWGVNTTDINIIRDWAIAVWPTSSAVFTAAATSACSYTAGDKNTPPVLNCI